jgi:hypothetical protein
VGVKIRLVYGFQELTMLLSTRGWSRDHGRTELFDIDLTETPVKTGKFTFGAGSPVLSVGINPHPSAKGAARSVTLHCFAQIRLGGEYNVKLEINKREIARLFYLTHRPEINGALNQIFGAFPWEYDSDGNPA